MRDLERMCQATHLVDRNTSVGGMSGDVLQDADEERGADDKMPIVVDENSTWSSCSTYRRHCDDSNSLTDNGFVVSLTVLLVSSGRHFCHVCVLLRTYFLCLK